MQKAGKETSLIRPLTPDDVEIYQRIRREALEQEPFAFGSSPSDDRARSADFVRTILASPDQAVFGAFAPELVGVVGVYRVLSLKSAHRAGIWGLYVKREHRSRGLGRSLLEAAINFARSLQGVSHVQLAVSERSPAAAALYESLGFVTWGVEPAALRIDGTDAAERHMVLSLKERAVDAG
jgi:ribosomal protein S18 acetylase RimI-like enzyme